MEHVASHCLLWQVSLQVPLKLVNYKQRVEVISPCLIHSLICELSGVFFCNNSDIQWSAGIFFEKT